MAAHQARSVGTPFDQSVPAEQAHCHATVLVCQPDLARQNDLASQIEALTSSGLADGWQTLWSSLKTRSALNRLTTFVPTIRKLLCKQISFLNQPERAT